MYSLACVSTQRQSRWKILMFLLYKVSRDRATEFQTNIETLFQMRIEYGFRQVWSKSEMALLPDSFSCVKVSCFAFPIDLIQLWISACCVRSTSQGSTHSFSATIYEWLANKLQYGNSSFNKLSYPRAIERNKRAVFLLKGACLVFSGASIVRSFLSYGNHGLHTQYPSGQASSIINGYNQKACFVSRSIDGIVFLLVF